MSAICDVAVVGGGPAGSAAAITAARFGYRVLLLERGVFPRQKVCGEFVSAEAFDLLKELVPGSHWHSHSPSISKARFFSDGKIREASILPAACSITRFELDAVLWKEASRSGAVTLTEQTVETIEGNGPFRIVTATESFDSRAVIDATGRWSTLNATGLATSGAALGIKRHYFEASPSKSVDLYFFEGGYCGVQPISADHINVSAMVWGTRRIKQLEDIFPSNPHLSARSQAWLPAGKPVSTFPLIFRKPVAADRQQNILRAGDAACFIDPFVGDGISMALHSGQCASQSLDAFLSGGSTLKEAALDYSQQYERRLMPAFRNAARLRKLIGSPWLRSIALELFRIPAISRLALRSTRASAA